MPYSTVPPANNAIPWGFWIHPLQRQNQRMPSLTEVEGIWYDSFEVVEWQSDFVSLHCTRLAMLHQPIFRDREKIRDINTEMDH